MAQKIWPIKLRFLIMTESSEILTWIYWSSRTFFPFGISEMFVLFEWPTSFLESKKQTFEWPGYRLYQIHQTIWRINLMESQISTNHVQRIQTYFGSKWISLYDLSLTFKVSLLVIFYPLWLTSYVWNWKSRVFFDVAFCLISNVTGDIYSWLIMKTALTAFTAIEY